MVKDIQLPEISENVTSGEVINILVGVGDTVSKEQTVIEVETEKAAVGIPTPFEGKVSEVLVTVGDTVSVGQPLLKLTTDGEAEQKPAGQPPPAEARQAEQPRQTEQPEQAPAKPAQAKPAQAKPAQAEPAQPTTAPARAGAERAVTPPPPAPEKTAAPRETGPGIPAPAAPSVRRLARELGIDIHVVQGSGPGGRISAEDVKNYVKQAVKTDEGRGRAGEERKRTAVELPDFSQWGKVRRESMSKVRAITAESMSQAWQTIPHVTQFDEADITLLNEFKSKYEKQAEKAGGKLTVTAILLKIVSFALKKFPQFNASLDEASQEIIYKDYINIGLAVDTDRGLLVPVVKDADRKSLIEVAVEITSLAEKARQKRLGLDELKGGNFTISNLGGIGGTNFTPIVYWPEVAILGVSRADWRPVYRDGQLEARSILPLSLSYDHRVIDGAQGARFLRWLVEALENPYLLVM